MTSNAEPSKRVRNPKGRERTRGGSNQCTVTRQSSTKRAKCDNRRLPAAAGRVFCTVRVPVTASVCLCARIALNRTKSASESSRSLRLAAIMTDAKADVKSATDSKSESKGDRAASLRTIFDFVDQVFFASSVAALSHCSHDHVCIS
jgi:hypothetical protein